MEPKPQPEPEQKQRKSRRVYDLKPEFLADYFHMSQKDAAAAIGVAVITVKRNCKRYGLKWPFRANKYKARNGVVLSEKGKAFSQLPLACMAEMQQGDDCDTDTESIQDEELAKKDCSLILFSMRKAPIQEDPLFQHKLQV
ncbi:unnamed protein product [Phytophthora lilii]|uniref:Unnamed protein product n=1 Tax=Phytophthora lilii TaxID=2077276 RepID=A0A9W6X6X9_9STRA|nr:unnamed protein product [Phytophthora lilii]